MQSILLLPKNGLRLFYSTDKVTVMVPYRMPGNVVKHVPVDFQIFQNGVNVEATPLCNEVVKRLTDLPDSLFFTLENGMPVGQRKDQEEVALAIAAKLSPCKGKSS